MQKNLNLDNPKAFIKLVIDGILEKKGNQIVVINLKEINNSIADYFIICSGDSNTQVNAIAEGIIEKVKENVQISPWHKEGLNNAQWVLLDYSNIIVHVFQPEFRDFYKLEDLWADGIIENYEEK